MSAGKKIRLKGLGFSTKVGGQERGDLYAVIGFELPTPLSQEQIEAVEILKKHGL
jgi:DnaJ-class molecular chaperone